MPYTAPPTKIAGDVLTSALWNTYVRDNFDAGVMRLLADSGTLAASAASIDFTSIPQTFVNLMLVAKVRGDVAAAATALLMRLNNDSGANYNWEQLSAGGTVVSGTGSTSQTSARVGSVVGASGAANRFAVYRILIADYANATEHKPVEATGSSIPDDTTSNWGGVDLYGSVWKAAPAALNRVTLLPGSGLFVAKSRVLLYGLPG